MSSNLRTMSSRYLRLKQFQTRFFPYLRHLVDTRWCTSVHSFNHYGKWREIWDNRIRIETLWGLFTLCIWVSLNFQTQKRSLENPGQFLPTANEVVECFQSCPSVFESFCPRRGGPKWTLPMTHWISLYSPLPPPSGTDTLDIGPHCIETPWTWDLTVQCLPWAWGLTIQSLTSTDIWWTRQETFSNLFTWGPPWCWHLVAIEEACTVDASGQYESY